jgi:peptidyl-prolyl cis-trans isomerase A (cyclophilin A)
MPMTRPATKRSRSARRATAAPPEALEPRLALAVTVLDPLADLTVPAVAGQQTISLAGRFDDPAVTGSIVRFDTNAAAPADRVFVELFDQAGPDRNRTTPQTVANFLGYVDRGDYTGTIIHRSVPGFVVQGGGFEAPTAASNQPGGSPTGIPAQPPVVNEPGNTNVRGTIAMAKVGDDPNSATNQWFFSLADNSANLDVQNGGFTAFGRVLGDGMTAVDAMAAVPRYNLGGAFSDLPLRDVPDPVPPGYAVQPGQYVSFPAIQRVGELVYTVTNSNPELLAVSFDPAGSTTLKLDHALGRSGTATITVRATAVFDPTNFVEDQFIVNRLPPTGPAAPTGLTVMPGNGVARLSWTAPTADGGATLTDYVVQSSVDGTTWTTFADGTSTAATALVTGLTNGTSYRFRVAGVNSAGTGDASGASAAVTPRSLFVVGAEIGVGSAPVARLVDAAGGAVVAEVVAFEPAFRGGVRVAMGDLDDDGIAEVAVASGPGRRGEVRFYRQQLSGDRIVLAEIVAARTLPFGSRYTHGVEIGIGDVDGDGREDLVAAMSRGAGTVHVFRSLGGADPIANAPFRAFTPFGSRFTGGATVAVADVGSFTAGRLTSATAGDGRVEIFVGSGPGMRPTVLVYDVSATPRIVSRFAPFAAGLGGVSVAAGRYDTDAIDDLVVSAGRGGGSAVKVFNGRIDQSAPAVLASSAAFASLARPQAAVFTAPVDADGDGRIDRFFGAQGDAGGSVGVLHVGLDGRRIGGLGGLRGPLRIAAPRVTPAG